MRIKSFLQHHAIAAYFILAYGISWTAVLFSVGLTRFSGQAVPADQLLVALPLMVLGPTTGGLLMTAIMEGKAGLRALFGRLIHWRVGIQWYAAAIFTVPALALLTLFTLSAVVSPAFLPAFKPFGIVVGLIAGIFEEIGWTGYALPRLRAKYPSLTAGLILGGLWGLWHFLAGFAGSTPGQETLWLAEALIFWLVGLTAYRVLIVWVYAHTNSLLVAIIMHAFLSGSLYLFGPVLSPTQNLTFFACVALLLCLTAAIVVKLTGKTLQGRTAIPTADKRRAAEA